MMKWILFAGVIAVGAVRPAEHVVEKHEHRAKVEKKVPCCNCEITSDWMSLGSTMSCKMFEDVKISQLSQCNPGVSTDASSGKKYLAWPPKGGECKDPPKVTATTLAESFGAAVEKLVSHMKAGHLPSPVGKPWEPPGLLEALERLDMTSLKLT
eukprot:Skav228580  [mRNA]  locus=scaffold1470:99891:101823:+ [translate_table: standard]